MTHKEFQSLAMFDEVQLHDGRKGIVDQFELGSFPFTKGMKNNATIAVHIKLYQPHAGEVVRVRSQEHNKLTLLSSGSVGVTIDT